MAKDSRNAVKVDGLADFRRELKKLDDPNLVAEFKQANYEIADEVVQHAEFIAAGVSRQAYSAAQSLKAARSGYQAEIAFRNRRGFEFGAEFGATRNKQRTLPSGRRVRGWNQFRPWRGNDEGAGYFLYPAVRGIDQRAIDLYRKRLDAITAEAFPD